MSHLELTNAFAFIALLGFASLGYAAAPRIAAPTLVSGTALRATTISVTTRGKPQDKSIFCMGTQAGSAKVRGTSYMFTSFSYALAKLQAKKASAIDISLAKQYQKKGATACSQPAGPPPPITTPQNPPSAIPTIGPTPSVGNFDLLGNVTEQGRILFAIPPEFVANVDRGKRIYLVFCVGCHVERVNRTYPDIETNIARSPMLYDRTQIPADQLADLIAYLNRFRP